MNYFKCLFVLEMWTWISIPVHIFESRLNLCTGDRVRKSGPGADQILSTAVRSSALKNLSSRVRAVAHGPAGKRWKKREPQRGSYYTRPPELCSEFSILSWCGFIRRMLRCSKTLPRRIQRVPFEKTSVTSYGPVVGLSSFRWMSELIINIFCPTR